MTQPMIPTPGRDEGAATPDANLRPTSPGEFGQPETPGQGRRPATPGQTVGPFFGFALPWDLGDELVPRSASGAVRLSGTVYDGNGDPVPDALIELWQPDADGKIRAEAGSLDRDGWTFTGFGRAAVDAAGRYTFTTLEPGSTRPGGARFASVIVFARGLLDRLSTRVYLPEADQPDGALGHDPLLSGLSADDRATLIATRDGAGGLSFDIRLQGPGETVFLDFDGTAADAPPTR